MEYLFEIPGTLPTLNQYVNKERTNRFMAAKIKRETQERIISCLDDDAPCFPGCVTVWFEWIRPDMRSDKDNVAFAKKFVLDALQEAGIITNDKWKLCTPYDRKFAVNKSNPRTVVLITDEDF